MSHVALIYPHQLFDPHPALGGAKAAVLVEEPLLFKQYAFHKQKLLFHRATMKRYAARISAARKLTVHYIEAREIEETGGIVEHLRRLRCESVKYVDPCDDWLERRLSAALRTHRIPAEKLDDPHFLTSRAAIDDFTADKRKLFFTEFYIAQRKRLGILLEPGQKPRGGQWSFDPENRKRLPKGVQVPRVSRPAEDAFIEDARAYVERHWPAAPGDARPFGYPTDHESAARWLDEFVRQRLAAFGDYEDAISRSHDVLFHSLLTPLLNVGLLSPRQVVDAALAHAERSPREVPLNSLEGFVRQVIGWREYVRLVYLTHGRRQRCRNFWQFTRPMPRALYDGTTGIAPVDHVVRQVLRTGYCHHIKRLMILGNFMLLCEIEPDEVYRWFMELFIDAYDWVMVPNVYGMSQHADGGFMTTKPYISGSAYVLKMSDFTKGAWCEIWDALYWRFIDRHSAFFSSNPRMAVMVKMKDKLGERIERHRRTAESFLEKLHES